MNFRFFVLLIAIAVLTATKVTSSQNTVSECRAVNQTILPICVKDGFVRTSVYLANDFKNKSKIINNIRAKLGNCSKYTNFILCSLYVPRCKKDLPTPWLPCRDVCDEFIRECGDQMNLNGLNWLKPLCSLLPTNGEANCFKPPEFNKTSTKPPPSLYCNKTVSNQNCTKVDCKRTFVPQQAQQLFKDNLNAIMNKLNKLNSSVKSDWCGETLTKLACASYTPPCDDNKIKTLCESRCIKLFVDCQKAFDFVEVSSYCAVPAEGYTKAGYCELKRWPSAKYWDKKSPWTLPFSFPAGLIAALVLVPLFALCFIYVAVAVRRRYEQKKSGYVQQRSTYTEPQSQTDTDNNLPV